MVTLFKQARTGQINEKIMRKTEDPKKCNKKCLYQERENGIIKKRNNTLHAVGTTISLLGSALHVAGAISFCVGLVLALLLMVSPLAPAISIVVGGLGMFAAKEGERLINIAKQKNAHDSSCFEFRKDQALYAK